MKHHSLREFLKVALAERHYFTMSVSVLDFISSFHRGAGRVLGAPPKAEQQVMQAAAFPDDLWISCVSLPPALCRCTSRAR